MLAFIYNGIIDSNMVAYTQKKLYIKHNDQYHEYVQTYT